MGKHALTPEFWCVYQITTEILPPSLTFYAPEGFFLIGSRFIHGGGGCSAAWSTFQPPICTPTNASIAEFSPGGLEERDLCSTILIDQVCQTPGQSSSYRHQAPEIQDLEGHGSCISVLGDILETFMASFKIHRCCPRPYSTRGQKHKLQ